MRAPQPTGWNPAPNAMNGIATINLDQKSIIRWNAKIEQERDIAIFDLLEANQFALKNGPPGPYDLSLSLRDATLVFALRDHQTTPDETIELAMPTRPLKQTIKDYFLICESYFDAIKGSTPSRIEAIDVARRGLHNEGAVVLAGLLAERVDIDHHTSRRLFTLICVLHLRGHG